MVGPLARANWLDSIEWTLHCRALVVVNLHCGALYAELCLRALYWAEKALLELGAHLELIWSSPSCQMHWLKVAIGGGTV